jgi:hypothetical protein
MAAVDANGQCRSRRWIFRSGGKAGPDLTADWPEIARHATIGLRLTRFQRYPTAAVKRRQSRGQTLACCNGLRAIYWVFDQSMELGLVASRRRAHPVRRSWAAGHRLRAMRRTWARWRDEARGAACRRQTHQSPSDALCWRGKLLLLTDRGSSLRLPNHAKVRQGSPNMTEEMSPQVLLTATGFAAGEALAVLRKHNIATAAFFRPPSIGACRKPVRRSTPKTAPRSCALGRTRVERRRDGPFAWGIFEDAGDLGRYEEAYLIESGLELMHLRERVTNADRCSRRKSGRC